MFGYKKLHVVAAARFWNLLSGLLLVIIASNVFSSVEQGIFYTFLSIGAAQYFFDLGVGFVLASLAGRNTPNDEENLPYGQKELQFLRAAVRFALKWAIVAGSALVVIIGAIGLYVFSTSKTTIPDIYYIWIAYVILIAFSMGLNLILRMFEGLGFVVEAAIARTVQSVTNITMLTIFAMYDLGVASIPGALLLSLIATALYFSISSEKIRSTFTSEPISTSAINWRKDIWPFQSRMAITWISGYVIFQAQTPMLYALSGPEDAGRFGIAVQIFQALNTSANIFLTYNMRLWTSYAGAGKLALLNHSFRMTTALTVSLLLAGCISVLACLLLANNMNLAMVSRFPDLKLLVLFSIAACFNQFYFCLSYYFRALGTEPLWWLSLIAAIFTLIVPFYLGKNYDILSAVLSFFIASTFILGIVSILYSIRLSRAPEPL